MRDGERWIFLFVLGVLVFNWPFLTILEGSHPAVLFASGESSSPSLPSSP